jgi:hypothetical protein
MALELLVGERAKNRHAEAEEHRAPPDQASLGADDGTLVPRDVDFVGIRIALAIANRGHKMTR